MKNKFVLSIICFVFGAVLWFYTLSGRQNSNSGDVHGRTPLAVKLPSPKPTALPSALPKNADKVSESLSSDIGSFIPTLDARQLATLGIRDLKKQRAFNELIEVTYVQLIDSVARHLAIRQTSLGRRLVAEVPAETRQKLRESFYTALTEIVGSGPSEQIENSSDGRRVEMLLLNFGEEPISVDVSRRPTPETPSAIQVTVGTGAPNDQLPGYFAFWTVLPEADLKINFASLDTAFRNAGKL